MQAQDGSPSKGLRLIICNEKPSSAEGVRNFFAKIPELTVVRGLLSAEEIIEAASEQTFDMCAIGCRSLNWWDQIRADLEPVLPRLGVQVSVASSLSAEYLVKSYRLGMHDVLVSSVPMAHLAQRCSEVLNGQRDITSAKNAYELASLMPENRAFQIVKDEHDIEIMMMLIEGRTNEEIADTLFLAIQTIRNRISRLMHDAGVQNRTQLAMLMVR